MREEVTYEKDVFGYPKVGTPVTICFLSDTYPGTVVWTVPSSRCIGVRQDDVTVVDGKYVYTPRTKGESEVYKECKARGGRFVRATATVSKVTRKSGHTFERTTYSVDDGGPSLFFGERRYYQDPSF